MPRDSCGTFLRSALAAALALPVLLSAASRLPAQELRGTIVEAGTGRAIEGAFVSLVDATGVTTNSALTAADGAYVVRTPIPGEYTVRVERIGYESWSSEPIRLTRGAVVTRHLEIPVLAVRLDELAVTVASHCRPRPGAGPEMARIWEEARKALELNRWTEEQSRIDFTLRRWERTLDPESERVRSEETFSAERRAWRTFVSASAEELSREGYARPLEDGDGWRFFAPDAEVLLSDTFADDHCFALVRGDDEQEGLVGLAFEPAPGRRTSDVSGVLWVDAASAELSHLAFEYVNTDLERALRTYEAGGEVRFARLPTGHWFVRRWRIRMPVAGERNETGLARGPGGGPFQPRRERVLAQVHESGGEAVRAQLPGGEAIDLGAWGAVAGVVRDDRGAVTAEVELAGTAYRGRTDAEGRFRIDPVPSGEYTLVARHPDAALLGIAGSETAVTVEPDREVSAELTLPSMGEVVVRVCEAPGPRADSAGRGRPSGAPPAESEGRRGAAFGMVRDRATGAPVAGATVWIGDADPAPAGAAGRELHTVRADSAGRWLACGVRGGDVLAQAATDAAASDTVRERVEAGALRRLDFELIDGRAPVARFAAGAGPDLDAVVDEILARGTEEEEDTGFATLVGTVRSAETGQPVSGARVRLVGRDDERITGEHGTFVIPDLPRGRYRVVTERLGLASDTAEVDLRLGAGTMASLVLETEPVQLPTLEVEIQRTFRSQRLAGYYDRMNRGLGDFVTAEDLEVRDVISNFRRIPSVRIQQCVNSLGMRTTNCWDLKIARGFGNRPCPPLVYIDGFLYSNVEGLETGGGNAFTLLQGLPRHRLEGIEMYRNPASAPAQYRMLGDACGIVLVWTRGR